MYLIETRRKTNATNNLNIKKQIIDYPVSTTLLQQKHLSQGAF